MNWLRDVPIRRKLVIVIMLATTLGLVTATTALMVWDILRFRADLREDLTALALITADNSTAAVQFKVPRDAEEVLSSLDAKPYITGAAVYDADGALFASFAASAAEGLPRTAPARRSKDRLGRSRGRHRPTGFGRPRAASRSRSRSCSTSSGLAPSI